jgi:hypothetical protein
MIAGRERAGPQALVEAGSGSTIGCWLGHSGSRLTACLADCPVLVAGSVLGVISLAG